MTAEFVRDCRHILQETRWLGVRIVLVEPFMIPLFQAANVDDRVWTRDGVHPTPFGHALIAQAWLRAVTPTA